MGEVCWAAAAVLGIGLTLLVLGGRCWPAARIVVVVVVVTGALYGAGFVLAGSPRYQVAPVAAWLELAGRLGLILGCAMLVARVLAAIKLSRSTK